MSNVCDWLLIWSAFPHATEISNNSLRKKSKRNLIKKEFKFVWEHKKCFYLHKDTAKKIYVMNEGYTGTSICKSWVIEKSLLLDVIN